MAQSRTSGMLMGNLTEIVVRKNGRDQVIKPKKLSRKFWKSKDGALPDYNDNELPNDEWNSAKASIKSGLYTENLYE